MKLRALLAALCLLLAPSLSRAQWQENGVPVATVTGDEQDCEIVSDGAGGSIIVWQTYYSYLNSPDIYAQRLDGQGYPLWTAGGVPVCTAAEGQYKPQVVPDGAGGAIIAWTDFRTGDPDIYAQRIDSGGNPLWTVDGIAVCTVTDDFVWYAKSRISLVERPGGAILVWYDNRSGETDVYAQAIDMSGALLWTPDGIAVCTETDAQGYVRAVPDGAGGAIALWGDWRSGEGDLYAQRIAADSSLLWSPGGVPVCTAAGVQGEHDAVADGAGGMICVWQDGSNEESDLYSQRIDAGGQPVWTIDGVPVCIEPNAQLWPKLAPDGLGGAFYSWTDRRNAVWYDQAIFVQHLSSSGDSLWPAGGILLRSPGIQWDNYVTEIISDCFGGAIVAWYTYAPLPLAASPPALPAFAGEDIESIYAQRVAYDGTVWWREGGVTLCDFPVFADPTRQKLIPDGSGGAFVVWYNNYNMKGIYAQRVNGIGNAPPTDAGERSPVPLFARNYPNPFNPSTTIVFHLPEAAHVDLDIYDAAGRHVRTLLNDHADAGRHEAVWNGTDDSGSAVASGVYFYRLEVDGLALTRKIVLLR